MDEQRKLKLQKEIDDFCEGLISNIRVSSAFSRIQTLAQTLGQEPYVVSITSGDPRVGLDEVVELKKELKSTRASLTKKTKKLDEVVADYQDYVDQVEAERAKVEKAEAAPGPKAKTNK